MGGKGREGMPPIGSLDLPVEEGRKDTSARMGV